MVVEAFLLLFDSSGIKGEAFLILPWIQLELHWQQSFYYDITGFIQGSLSKIQGLLEDYSTVFKD